MYVVTVLAFCGRFEMGKKWIVHLESIYRERDIDHDHDALLQQQQEKDQQYNSMVKSLKDRVCTQDIFCCS